MKSRIEGRSLVEYKAIVLPRKAYSKATAAELQYSACNTPHAVLRMHWNSPWASKMMAKLVKKLRRILLQT